MSFNVSKTTSDVESCELINCPPNQLYSDSYTTVYMACHWHLQSTYLKNPVLTAAVNH